MCCMHTHTQTLTVRVVFSCSLAGVLGAVVGWGVAAYRNLPSHVYSLSLAANFAVVSGAFLGTVYSDGRFAGLHVCVVIIDSPSYL